MWIYSDILVSYLHINTLGYVPYIWHLMGILIVDTYMAITCFLSCDTISSAHELLASGDTGTSGVA